MVFDMTNVDLWLYSSARDNLDIIEQKSHHWIRRHAGDWCIFKSSSGELGHGNHMIFGEMGDKRFSGSTVCGKSGTV